MLPPEKELHYPKLRAEGYTVTSAETINAPVKYNCVAWAADGENRIWWEPVKAPGFYWPAGISEDGSIKSYVELFQSLGYTTCNDNRVELLSEKIALYGYPDGEFSHVAYQLYYGWTSKLGDWEDIWHKSLAGLEGDYYGHVKVLMKRRCRLRGFFARAFFSFVSQHWPKRRGDASRS